MAVSALTSIGSLALSAIGLTLQNEATEEAQRSADFFNLATLNLQSRSLEAQIRSSREQLALAQKESRKTWQWREEDRKWQRGKEFIDRFNSVIDKEPAFKNNLVNIWSRSGQS